MPKLEPYGNHWGGDGLFNMRIGYAGFEGAYRFLAKQNVTVDSLRYFNTYSFKKPGYHLGTGGKILIELRSDDGSANHVPGPTVLASAKVPNPLEVAEQLLVKFDKSVQLKAGELYHIVFRNYDADPEANHVSIDMMAILSRRDLQKPEQPCLAPFDMTTLVRDKYNKNWRPFKPDLTCTPIFTLYQGEKVAVPGYGGMESWVASPKRIAGPEMVRQFFKPHREIEVENVAVRIAKNGNPGPLKATLHTGNCILAESTLPSVNVAPIDTKLLPPNRLGHQWVTFNFSSRVRLLPLVSHYLKLSAPEGDAYEVFPLRDGSHKFGYSSVWPNAWAEFTATGETGWSGWEAWGNKDLKLSHLQLYFNA